MPYFKGKGPFGVNPSLREDRINLIQIVNGDTFEIDADLHDPSSMDPASPANTVVEFVLSEDRFSRPIWTGRWIEGVVPDKEIPGLVHVKVPGEVTSTLRRGVYAFSLKVTDVLDHRTETQLEGHFQVEYEPSSDCHNIPYRRDWEDERHG